MTWVWAISAGGAGAVVTIATLAHIAARRSRVLSQGSAYLQQFATAAKFLIEDKTVPDNVVEFVNRIADEAGRRGIAYWVAGEIRSGRLYDPSPPTTPEGIAFRESLSKLDAKQRQVLAQCMAYCLLSSAASHFLL